MPKYVAIINTPGHLPESEPAEFDTAQEAWDYLADERKRAEEEYPEWTDPYPMLPDIAEMGDSTGIVYGSTPGYEGNHDLGVAYNVQLAETGEDNTPHGGGDE